MSEVNLPIAIVFAILYTLTLNISKGIQKYGIGGLSVETIKKWREKPELKKNFIIWLIGSIGTAIAALFQLSAQPYTPNASFVPAFSGIGLMGLVIFSHFLLNEKAKIPEIVGTIIIIIATLIFGLVAEDKPSVEVDYLNLILIFIIPIVILFGIAYISGKNDHRGHAIIWGTIAGICAGFSIALSHTAAIEGEREFLGMVITFNMLFSLITAQGSFWFTQVGFKHGHATSVVTMYSTLSLAVPILIDFFVLDYVIPGLQLIMMVVIGIGVVLLTAFREPVAP